jgi:hypothetical protein
MNVVNLNYLSPSTSTVGIQLHKVLALHQLLQNTMYIPIIETLRSGNT